MAFHLPILHCVILLCSTGANNRMVRTPLSLSFLGVQKHLVINVFLRVKGSKHRVPVIYGEVQDLFLSLLSSGIRAKACPLTGQLGYPQRQTPLSAPPAELRVPTTSAGLEPFGVSEVYPQH